jgi:hypothetical protein
MHKEIVERKKFPAMVFLFITLITLICLSDILTKIGLGSVNMKTIIIVLFSILMIILCYIEFLKCKIKYKYLIVADQFIIHKIKGEEITVLEDVKFKNINFIGKCSNCNANIHISTSKRYICSTFLRSKFCCVYKSEGKFNKFYFEPSEGLINKITLLKENQYFSGKS